MYNDNKYIYFKDGNNIVFNDYFKENFPKYVQFANRFLKDQEHSEDIVQDAFLKVWESEIKKFYSEIELNAFMYKTLQNTCLNHIKHLKVKKRHDEYFSKEIESQHFFIKSVWEEESNFLLYKAIDTLTPQCREVIKYHLEGKKNQEIADIMGINIITVKSHKTMAFKELKSKLSKLFYYILF